MCQGPKKKKPKPKWEETTSDSKSEIFLLLNLTPPQIILFSSPPLKTKRQCEEIKNATWSFYFLVCASSSFSSLALAVITPVTSPACWLRSWLTARSAFMARRERVKHCPQTNGLQKNSPQGPPYETFTDMLPHDGTTRKRKVSTTGFINFSPHLFHRSPLFWAAVPTFPLLHPSLVLPPLSSLQFPLSPFSPTISSTKSSI